MGDQVAIGISGLTISPRTHLCGFFHGDGERNEMVVPFIEEGLRAGDKCLCAFEAPDGAAVAAALQAMDVDVDAAGDQLDVVRSQDIYFGDGRFDLPEAVDHWERWATDSLGDQGYAFARMAGEMTTPMADVIGAGNLALYESELNRYILRYPQVLLCLYDLDHFSGQVLVDILRTHPKVLMGQTVLENLYYVEPDEFLASRG
jgi:hypothetical protein